MTVKLKKRLNLRERLKTCETLPELNLKKPLTFVDSGSWMLNLALTNDIGKGYPIGRVVNVVGDYSTGKTLLACELVNSVWYIEHLRHGKKVKIYYDEPEHAFDYGLAAKFNMPVQEIIGLREGLKGYKPKKGDKPFKRSKTVEDFYRNLERITKEESNQNDIIIYIIDSLDSVSDAREIRHIEQKGIDKQDMGGSKARVLSQLFRNCIEGVNNSNILLMILSQIRMNIGVTFGNPHTRAGGKALDHYSSQIFFLKERTKITSSNKINQGISVEVKVDKNKTGSRYNQLDFDILHGWGIDNFSSAVNFLWDHSQFQRNGNYIIWNDKNYYRKDLIELCASHDTDAAQLKSQMQCYWNELIKEAEVKRKPKWGSNEV